MFVLRQLSNEEKGFVRNCVDVIHKIVRLYGFNDIVDGTGFKLKGTYDHWIYCCSMVKDHPMKFVKYKIASYFSVQLGQVVTPTIWNELMECGKAIDNANVLIGGRVMKYLQKMKRCDKNRFESFFTTVLYSKKGMPRPSKQQCKDAEKETFVKLTTKPVTKPGFYVNSTSWGEETDRKISTFVDKERLNNAIKRVVSEVFKDKQYTDVDRQQMFFPSTSANYINSRRAGGVIGQLFGEHSDLLDGLKSKNELITMGKVIYDDMNEFSRSSKLTSVNMDELEMNWKILYHRICERALIGEKPYAVPMGLPEALKIRVITKGPGLLYTALKPLQKFLIKHLSAHKTFTLTGRTVDGLTLQDIIGAKLKDDEYFMSVDYSDATNQIESWVTNQAMNAIAEQIGLTLDEHEMALTSLTGHIMSPDSKTNKGALPQLNGQLMGGILSFIILCVVNASVLLTTKEIVDNRTYTLRDCNIAINGDDGVMKTTLWGMKAWEQIGSFVGLSPSIGKVYFDKTYLNINSTSYNFYPLGWESFKFQNKFGDDYVRTCHYEHIKYVNMGQLLSMKRSGNGLTSVDEDARGVSFGGRVSDLINSAPCFLQERLLGQFLHINKDKIMVDLPYFIPENMGGLGLPSIGKFTSSNSDLRFARLIQEHPDKFKMPMRPLNAEWKTWEYAQRRFPEVKTAINQADILESRGLETMSLSQVRAKACIEAIFRCDSIEELLKENADDSAILVYQRKCQKIWKRARLSSIPVPEPYIQGKFPKQYNLNDLKCFLVTSSYYQDEDHVNIGSL